MIFQIITNITVVQWTMCSVPYSINLPGSLETMDGGLRTISNRICHCRAIRIQRIVISLRLTGTCCQLMQNTRCKVETIAKHHPTCKMCTCVCICACVCVCVCEKESTDSANTLTTQRNGKDGNERVFGLWVYKSTNLNKSRTCKANNIITSLHIQ